MEGDPAGSLLVREAVVVPLELPCRLRGDALGNQFLSAGLQRTADALPAAIDGGQHGVALGAVVILFTDDDQRETVHAFGFTADVINWNIEVASDRHLAAGGPGCA